MTLPRKPEIFDSRSEIRLCARVEYHPRGALSISCFYLGSFRCLSEMGILRVRRSSFAADASLKQQGMRQKEKWYYEKTSPCRCAHVHRWAIGGRRHRDDQRHRLDIRKIWRRCHHNRCENDGRCKCVWCYSNSRDSWQCHSGEHKLWCVLWVRGYKFRCCLGRCKIHR